MLNKEVNNIVANLIVEEMANIEEQIISEAIPEILDFIDFDVVVYDMEEFDKIARWKIGFDPLEIMRKTKNFNLADKYFYLNAFNEFISTNDIHSPYLDYEAGIREKTISKIKAYYEEECHPLNEGHYDNKKVFRLVNDLNALEQMLHRVEGEYFSSFRSMIEELDMCN